MAERKNKAQLTTLRGAHWWREIGWKHIVGIAVIIYCVIPLLYVLSVSFVPNAVLTAPLSLSNGISFDNFKVGVAQGNALLFGLGLTDKDGKKLDNAPKGPLNIELFAGSPDDNNAKFFFDGAMSVLKPYLDDGTLVVKSGQTSFDQVAILRWQQEVAQKRMEDLLTSTYGGGSEPLAGVLSPFDGISRGIITALQGAGYGPAIKDGLPIVTGQDAEIASTKMIADGIQQSTIFKDTRTLAAQAVTVVKAMAEGKEPEANDTSTYNNGVKVVPSYLLEVETIYADNLKEKLIDSGYFTQADVDAGVVKK